MQSTKELVPKLRLSVTEIKKASDMHTKMPDWFWKRFQKPTICIYLLSFIMLMLSLILAICGNGQISNTSDNTLQGKYASLFLNILNFLPFPTAVANVFSMIGFSGLAVAWLISILDYRVCGIKVSILRKWAYPKFFVYYFIILCNVGVGRYMGDASQNVSTTICLVTAIVGIILAGRVCYVLVLSMQHRIRIAYSCALYNITKQKDTEKALNFLLGTAAYTNDLMRCSDELNIPKFVTLWTSFLQTHKALSSREAVEWTSQVWSALLANPLPKLALVRLAQMILKEMLENLKNEEESCRYVMCGMVLALALFDANSKTPYQAFETIALISTSNLYGMADYQEMSGEKSATDEKLKLIPYFGILCMLHNFSTDITPMKTLVFFLEKNADCANLDDQGITLMAQYYAWNVGQSVDWLRHTRAMCDYAGDFSEQYQQYLMELS